MKSHKLRRKLPCIPSASRLLSDDVVSVGVEWLDNDRHIGHTVRQGITGGDAQVVVLCDLLPGHSISSVG